MKKIILSTVLVVGMVLTTGQGSKLVAGDIDAHIIEAIANTARQMQEAWCRITGTARESGSKNPSQKCDSNDIYVNWDVVLNLFAEYFACVEDHGNDERAVKYCRCYIRATTGSNELQRQSRINSCKLLNQEINEEVK